jgi:small nuclear ribonucleoprotein
MSAVVDVAGEFLRENVDKSLLIKLRGGKIIKGTLLKFDQYSNLLLKDSVELVKGDDQPRRLGNTLIRGDSIIIITPNLQ